MSRQARKHPHLTSYNDGSRRDVEIITIPEWILCSLCGTRRTKAFYSKAALSNLRQKIRKEGSNVLASQHTGLIRCIDCASNPLQSERKCKMCGVFKSLDCFARNQRKYQQPTCIPCQDYMMNDDIEFTTRSKERALQHWEEHMRGREGAQRLLLDAPGDDENDNDSGPAPARLYRRHLLIHEALEESTGNELVKASTSVQSSTAGPANDSFNRATATQPPKANYDDDLESTASSTLLSLNGFLLNDYGSDDDTIVPSPEKARTGWSKIRPNRYRTWPDGP